MEASDQSLVVNEIYLSVQGESSYAGLPCVFVRLTACDLRCSYCDTAYAFREGKRVPLIDVERSILDLANGFPNTPHSAIGRLPLVELTGGEPLLQKATLPLMKTLCDAGYTVLIETSGAHDVGAIDPRVHRIMDLKCPSSGESERNLISNIPLLTKRDEVKFVIGTWEDYEFLKQMLSEHDLAAKCPVLVSWVAPLLDPQKDASLKSVPAGFRPITRKELVEKLVEDRLPVRFQLQMHKFIWPPEQRGV